MQRMKKTAYQTHIFIKNKHSNAVDFLLFGSAYEHYLNLGILLSEF